LAIGFYALTKGQVKSRDDLLSGLRAAIGNDDEERQERVWRAAVDLARFAASDRTICLAHSFSPTSIFRAVACHWAFFGDRAPALLAVLLARREVPLWRREVEGRAHEVDLALETIKPIEGEFSLQYSVDGASLYTLSFVVAPGCRFGLADSEVLFVTRMQGQAGAFAEIRQAAKALGDIAPQAVLFTLARTLAQGFGLAHVVGVSGCDQIAYEPPLAPIFQAQYDDFLAAVGGRATPAGFVCPAVGAEAPPEGARRSKHPARAERKRRLKAEMGAQALANLRARFEIGAAASLSARERSLRRRSLLREAISFEVAARELQSQPIGPPLLSRLRRDLEADALYLVAPPLTDDPLAQEAGGAEQQRLNALQGFETALRSALMRQGERPPGDYETLAHGLFDRDYYLAANWDMRRGDVDPVRHYLDHGAFERRNPSAFFSTTLYKVGNPEIAQSGANPLAHFTRLGCAAGRRGVLRS
jgi:uncharacterized protein VirK/YbjX